VLTELWHQRLYAIQQAEGGKTGSEQRKVGVAECWRTVANQITVTPSH
jgi:hypothetical protein